MNAPVRVAVIVTCLIFLFSLSGCGGGGSSAVVQHTSTLAFVTTSLPSGAWLMPYSQTIQVTGGLAPFKWAVSTGSLPHNLSLDNSTSNTVTISGTPDTPAANVAFNIMVTDSSGQTATQPFNISNFHRIFDYCVCFSRRAHGRSRHYPEICRVRGSGSHQ